jgi:hypothetical protein
MNKVSQWLLGFSLALSLMSGYANTAQAADEVSEITRDLFGLWIEDWIEDWQDGAKETSEFPLGLHVFFNSGYQHSELGPLNSALKKQGYTSLGEDLWSSGGAMQLVAWHMIYEVEGQAAIHAPINNEDYQALAITGNTFFNVGYEFKPMKGLRIYPVLGVGASVLDLYFVRRSRLPSFDEFVSNPGWNGAINNTMFALNLGVGLELQGWLGTLGLRGGYIFHPIGSSWWSNGTSNNSSQNPVLLPNGPEMALNGPYLKLVAGF